MLKKIVWALSITLISVVILSGCSSKKDDDTFVVGMEAGYPPYNWTQKGNSNGAVKIKGSNQYAGGYDVQIAKKITKKLGKKLVVVKTEWDGLIPALQSNKIDGVIAGMSPTAERKKSIDFSDSYYRSQLVMVVMKNSTYANATSIQAFSGAKVTAQLNTFHYNMIKQINGVKKQTALDNFPAMRVALQAGKIDAYVSELPEGISASNAMSDIKYIQFDEKNGFKTNAAETETSVGLKKDSELKAEINGALKEISQTQRDSIMKKAIKNQPED